MASNALGDSHNFGRRVVSQGARVEKPRTVFWEWLLLSARSPLRRTLKKAAATDPVGPEALDFLPDLSFTRARGDRSGSVSRIALAPIRGRSAPVRAAVAVAAGRALAWFSWFGVSDLHWENLALGLDRSGRVVFSPLDVELIFGRFELPTETNLLPDADPDYAETYRHAAGIRRALSHLGKPVAARDLLKLVAAYRALLDFLDRHRTAIAETLRALPEIRTAPIRVSVRGTDEYVRAREHPVDPPLLDAEAEQLARGDIPYFFRRYGEAGIRYYTTPALDEEARLPLRGDVPKLPELLSLERDLRAPSREKLRNEGLLAILGAFDHPSFDGTHAIEELTVSFRPRSLVVAFPDGEELRASRDLSAFVGSVYLPCRCGEVRSVLVPRVTRCTSRTNRVRGEGGRRIVARKS